MRKTPVSRADPRLRNAQPETPSSIDMLCTAALVMAVTVWGLLAMLSVALRTCGIGVVC